MNWSNVKSLAIPVGGTARDVKRVSIGGSVVWEKPSPLPYDSEVEYLESTGTQYIATGITPASNSTVRVEGLFGTAVAASGRQFHFSDGNQNVTHYCEINNNKQYGGLGGYINQTLTRGELYSATGVFTASDATYTINISGTDYSATSTTATSASWRELVLFRINSSYNGNGVRIGACKIYVNGVLVRDFIAVRKSNVGYLYDRVSGALFGNAGTGDFVLGPDVVPVEYIESDGGQYINTGTMASDCSRIDLSFAVRTGGFRNYLFGCSSNTYGYVEIASTNKFKTENTSNFNIELLQQYNVVFKKSGYSVFINGTDTGIACGRYSDNVSLFSRSENYAISTTAADGRYRGKALFYGVHLYSEDTSLKQFVPIRVGSGSTWEGAMMDTLTRRIYRNAGTGAFTYGADLPYPIGG